MATAPVDIIPRQGERLIIVGQTGSGKTSLVTYILQRMKNTPVIIYDTKIEPKFEALPGAGIAHDDAGVDELMNNPAVDYIIYRPDIDTVADWRLLDDLLLDHYNHRSGADAYIDELLSFHSPNSGFGKGLVALYTRGRSRGITTVAATQRPARVSKFSLSEAQAAIVFHLNSQDDRKKVAAEIGMPEQINPPQFHFWYWRAGSVGDATLFSPAPLHPAMKTGYTDAIPVSGGPAPAPELDGVAWLGPRKFWALHSGT